VRLLRREHEGRAMLDAILQHVPVGLAVTGGPPDFALLRVSQHGLRMGQPVDPAQPAPALHELPARMQVYAPDGRTRLAPEQLPLYRAARLGEEVRDCELTIEVADGRQVQVLVNAAPIRGIQGEIVAAIVTWLDIGARKRAEAMVHQLNAELEAKVRERTAELEIANQELEAFSYSVSHDMRAWLGRIDGFSYLLKHDHGAQLDDEGARLIERIRASVASMSGLVSALLQLAHVTRAELRREVVDLAELTQAHADQLAAAEPQRSVEWSIPARLPVHADAELLKVALANLLGNAWKFTAGSKPARIGLAMRQAGDEAAYCVSDTGVGFDPTHADKLFKPFERLHAAQHYPGSGLGLSIVQRIIQRHGGRIWAESSPGQGARFCFTLGPAASGGQPLRSE